MSHLFQEVITWKDPQIILPNEGDTVLVLAPGAVFDDQSIYTAQLYNFGFVNCSIEAEPIDNVILWAELPTGGQER